MVNLGIIQKKSASGSWTLSLVIFDKKCPFSKNCFKVFLGKTMPKAPILKDYRQCPKILDYTLSIILTARCIAHSP